jgi:hypothetical protein
MVIEGIIEPETEPTVTDMTQLDALIQGGPYPTEGDASNLSNRFARSSKEDLWNEIRDNFHARFGAAMESFFGPNVSIRFTYGGPVMSAVVPPYMVMELECKDMTLPLNITIAVDNGHAYLDHVLLMPPQLDASQAFSRAVNLSRGYQEQGREPGWRRRQAMEGASEQDRFSRAQARFAQGNTPVSTRYVWDGPQGGMRPMAYAGYMGGGFDQYGHLGTGQIPPEPIPDSTFGGATNAEVRMKFTDLSDIQPMLDSIGLRYPRMQNITKELIPQLVAGNPAIVTKRQFYLHILGDWYGVERFGCLVRLVVVDEYSNRVINDLRFDFFK